MDALSSQANVAGYKSALIAAERLPKFFPMLMTAAGTVAPAKVLVLGAGVAGLQAIATARRLGAVVTAFDVRPVVQEQVESLGAKFLDLGIRGEETEGGYARELSEEEQRRAAAGARGADPRVRRRDHHGARPRTARAEADPRRARCGAMRPGSVIVDLAAEAGGNCELTEPGAEVVREGVTIAGPTNLPRRCRSTRASSMRATSARSCSTSHQTASSSSTSTTRSPPAPASRGRRWQRDQSVVPAGADDLRARDLPRLRGDLEGADTAAHAADVGHERHPRDRDRRRDPRRGPRGRGHADAGPRVLRRHPRRRRTSSAASS